MMGQRWRTALRVAGLIVSLMAGASCVSGAERTEADVHLFLSPYCGISQRRFVEAVPGFSSFENLGGELEFHLIALRGDAHELSTLQHLVCANAQKRFIPYFLFVSRAVQEGRDIHHKQLAQTLGLDVDVFERCVQDSTYSDAELERSRSIFDAFTLSGVPSVLVKSRAFTFRDMQEVVDAYKGGDR